MKNSEFLAAIYGQLGDDYGWTTSFSVDPNFSKSGMWAGSPWLGTPNENIFIDKRQEDNNFFCVSVMEVPDTRRRRTKDAFQRMAVLLADDADIHRLDGPASYILETSKENYQIGILLDPADPDTKNGPLLDAVLQAMIAKSYIKADSSGNSLVRYGRCPVGCNTKKRDTGIWEQRLLYCDLKEPYSLADAVATFNLDLEQIRNYAYKDNPAKSVAISNATGTATDYIKSLMHPDPEERDYHEPLLKLSAGMVAAGMRPGAVVNFLRSLMLTIKPEVGPELDRWEARFGPELPRMVASAEAKYAEERPAINVEGLIMTPEQVIERTQSQRWLVRNLVASNSVGMVFGASGTFKSFIALDLALHVAGGMPFAKQDVLQGPVIYVAAEGGAGIGRRIQAWQKEHCAYPLTDVGIVIQPLLLSLKEEIDMLKHAIAMQPKPPVLVVVDTLAQTYSGDENSSSDVSAYLRALGDIRAQFGCTVLVIHHTGHAAAERPRGSSALTANTDFMLGVHRPDPEKFTAKLSTSKQKDGEKMSDLYFDMERVDLADDDQGYAVSSLVSKFHDAVSAVLQDADSRHKKYQTIIYRMLQHGEPISVEEMRIACMSISDNNRDNATRGVNRALKHFAKEKMARQVSPGLWILSK